MTKRTAISAVAAAACAVAALVPGAAFAGKPGGGGSTAGSSVSLVPLYTHAGGPVIGDRVTFSVSSSTTSVWVRNQCWQGSTLVYNETHGFYPDYPWGTTYTLGPTSLWTAGGASCRADLITTTKRGTSTLATTSYAVAG